MPEEKDLKIVNELIDVVSRVKVKVNIPHPSAATPRYYLIIVDDKMELVDIIGVKRNLVPTKWSYNFGYWHPKCQIDIINSLKKLIESS